MNGPLEKSLLRIIREHSLAIDKLTEEQMVGAMRQAVDNGDFIRLVQTNTLGQDVIYIPYYEQEKLRSENNRLREFLKLSDRYIAQGFYEVWKEMRDLTLGVNFND